MWNIDEAVRKVQTPDRMTAAISEVQLTSDNQMCFVRCQQSDELGVVDMSTGSMLDLMTHDSPVEDFAISPDGTWVLVSMRPKRRNTAFNLWNMEERRIVMETGDASGYCVQMKGEQKILMIGQREPTFKAPYYMSALQFSGSEFYEHQYSISVDIIRSKPFLTEDDKYLIVNSAAEFNESRGDYSQPCIKTYKVNEGLKMASYGASELKFEDHFQDILQIKACSHATGSMVVAIFSCKSHARADSDGDTARDSGYGSPVQNTYGFFQLDVAQGTFTKLCIPFPAPDPMTNKHRLVFSRDATKCLDDFSNVFDVDSGMYIGQIPGPDAPGQCFALGGSVVLYSKGSVLYVVREDGTRIARCNVHSPICLVHVCSDDRTLVVGCSDGTMQSYTIMDRGQESVLPILTKLKSRRQNKVEEKERRLSRYFLS